MALIADARADRSDFGQSFKTIQAHTGDVGFNNLATTGQSIYFGKKIGVPRRAELVPNPLGAAVKQALVWRFCEPRIGSASPRAEGTFVYESNSVTRWFMDEIIISGDASSPDYWIDDTTSYSVVSQWHEYQQLQAANGSSRSPPFEFNVYSDANGPRLRLVTSTDRGIAIISLTRSGNVATATTSAPHGLSTGDQSNIYGVSPTAYNGKFTVTVTSPTTFTYVMSSTPATDAPINNFPTLTPQNRAAGFYVATSYDLGPITRNKVIRRVVQAKCAGASDDFINIWIDGVQVLAHSGYAGFADGLQNFYKIGAYTYPGGGSTWNNRVAYYLGFIMGDQTETYDSMVAKYDTPLTVLSRDRTRYSVAIIGGSNVFGADTSTVLHRSLAGSPCQDPVIPAQLGGTLIAPAATARASIAPLLQNAIYNLGAAAYVWNCAATGVGLTSYVGQCKGTYQTGTTYLAGDSVTPASPTGVTSFAPLGMKYICKVGGTSGGSTPTWPTAEYGSVTDSGGVVWEAERREEYDVSGHTYTPGELGFDPLGLTHQALCSVRQRADVDRFTVVALPLMDAAQNTSTANAIAVLTAHFAAAGVKFTVSAQSVSGTLLFGDMPAIAKALAIELIW